MAHRPRDLKADVTISAPKNICYSTFRILFEDIAANNELGLRQLVASRRYVPQPAVRADKG